MADPTLRRTSRSIEGVNILPSMDMVPFYGGMDIVREIYQLQMAGYSDIQNMRPLRPGFIKRKGMVKLHSTADSTNKCMSLFMFSKGKQTELHTYAQMSDGDLLEATNNPPTVTTGAFGSSVLTSVTPASMVPASYAVVDDKLFYADGTHYGKINSGSNEPVSAFIVYKGSGALPAVPTIGEDYSSQAADGDSTTVIVLDSVSNISDYDSIYIRTETPASGLTFTVSAGNTTASDAQVHYYNGSWTEVSALNDGTETLTLDVAPGTDWSVGNTITGQTSSKTCVIVAKISSLVYQIQSRSGAFTDGEVLTNGTYTADQGTGYPKVSVLGASGTMSWTMPTDVVPIYIFGQNGFWTRLSLASGAFDSEVEVSAVTYNSSFVSLQNVWDGVTLPGTEAYVYNGTDKTYQFFASGSIDVGGLTSSDKIYVNCLTPAIGMYISVNDIPNETASTTMTVKYFNGASYATTSATDSTVVDSKSVASDGFVTWAHPSAEQPTVMFSSQYYSYWYEITFNATLSDDMTISVDFIPYYTMADFGKCHSVCSFKHRFAYAFDRLPGYIAISSHKSPFILNGSSFAIKDIGDGRANKVTCMKKFYNEMLVWQAEKGKEGGCLTLIEGESIDTFGKRIISTSKGTFSSKSAVVVDGIPLIRSKDEVPNKVTMSYFLSRDGVYRTDGRIVELISNNVQDYFDPKDSKCIRRGYENEHWIDWDSQYQVIRIGLASGASATVANVFLVYDPFTGSWSHDVLANALSCHAEVESVTGQYPVVQIGGGTADGTMYLLNSTNQDVSTNITAYATMEFDGNGHLLHIEELIVRGTGTITVTPTKDGSAGSDITLS